MIIIDGIRYPFVSIGSLQGTDTPLDVTIVYDGISFSMCLTREEIRRLAKDFIVELEKHEDVIRTVRGLKDDNV